MEQTDWTQSDIITETESRVSGAGFFRELNDVTGEAFGDIDIYECGPFQFDMGKLRVGDILEFFKSVSGTWGIEWHKESGYGGAVAHVAIMDREIAERFRDHFKIEWLDQEALEELMGGYVCLDGVFE